VFQRVKNTVRPKAVRALDDALMTHYVRQEDVVRELAELTRLLTDRFDAEAEAVAVLGQRLAALGAQMEQMQDELRSRP
jgi:acetylornithine deacetylase/succinyl-diaminopimelate desuccinylase-like protein